MLNYLSNQVKQNFLWVLKYDRTAEIKLLRNLFLRKGFLDKENLFIADIGCGNGRSAFTIREIFGNCAEIIGIDKIEENIEIANQNNECKNCKFYATDAFDYFSQKINQNKFDIAFFSWSLFDMTNEKKQEIKTKKLNFLLNLVKKCIKKNGIIVVLQPTKGGVFEQLLSEFIPSSDVDYMFVHNFLVNYGFKGAINALPYYDEKYSIWSKFEFETIDEIFLGISSILYLEQKEMINIECFNSIFNNFLKKRNLSLKNLELTDCVNLYYYVL